MKFRIVFLFAVVSFLLISCSQEVKTNSNVAVKVIFDTDMGNDIDDALALDMLYKGMDNGTIDLLGIMCNKNCAYSPKFIDIMNTWYGYANIPIGIVRNGADTSEDGVNINNMNYVEAACKMVDGDKPMFETTLDNYDSLPDAHILYRKLLASEPDSSVTIISVGFSTNLARLLDTPADEYSPLSGLDLIKAKVKVLSVMACNFSDEKFSEYNVNRDLASAQKVFNEWPTDVIVSPFDVGIQICYPASSIENDFNWGFYHPVVEAYNAYLPMPYDRPTWDLTSVLYVMGGVDLFNKSERGTVQVNELESIFTPHADGRHIILSVDSEDQKDKILKSFVDIMTTKPKNKQ